MRLTYIFAVTVVATLHASATAFASAKESKAAIENGAVPAIVDSTLAEGGRLLRRVDTDEDDLDDLDDDDDDRNAFDEERGFSLKKLNPVTIAKNSAQKAADKAAAQSAKVKEALNDAADYQEMIKNAKKCWQDDASTSCGIPVDTGMTITQWDRNHSCDYGTVITGR